MRNKYKYNVMYIDMIYPVMETYNSSYSKVIGHLYITTGVFSSD